MKRFNHFHGDTNCPGWCEEDKDGDWIRFEDFEAYRKRAEEELALLHALEAAGVDNWDGYDYAREFLETHKL